MNLSQMKIFEEIEKALKNSQGDLKNLFESKDITIDTLWLFNTNVENLVDGSIYDVISAFKKDMKKNEELINSIYYLKNDNQNIVIEDIEAKYPLLYGQLDNFFTLATSRNSLQCFKDVLETRLDLIKFATNETFNKYKSVYSIEELLDKSDSVLKNKVYNNKNLYEYLLYAEERYVLGELASSIKNVSYDITKDTSANISLTNAISSLGSIATVRVDKQGNLFLKKENGEISINDDSKSPKQRIYDVVEAKDEYINAKTYYSKNAERNELIKPIISLFNDIPYMTKLEIDSSIDLNKLKISLENIKRLNLPLENGVILRYRLTGKHNATGLYIDGLKTVVIDLTKSSSVVHELTHALDYAKFFKDNKKDIIKMNQFNNYEYAGAFGLETNYYNSLVEITARGGEVSYALMEADIGDVYKAYISNGDYNGVKITDDNFYKILLKNSESNFKIIGEKLEKFNDKIAGSVYFNLKERTPSELYGIYQTYEKAFGFKDVIQTKVFDNIYVDMTGNRSTKTSYRKRKSKKEGLDSYKAKDFEDVVKSFTKGYIFEYELPDFVGEVLINTTNSSLSNKSNLIDNLKITLNETDYSNCIIQTKDLLDTAMDERTHLYPIIYELTKNGIISKDEYKKFNVIASLEQVIEPIAQNQDTSEIIKYLNAMKDSNSIYYFDKEKTGNFDATINYMKVMDFMNNFYKRVNNEVGFSATIDLSDNLDENFNLNGKMFLKGEKGDIKECIIPFKNDDDDDEINGLILKNDIFTSLKYRLNQRGDDTAPLYESLKFEISKNNVGYLTIPNTRYEVGLRNTEYSIVKNVSYDNQLGLCIDGKEYGDYVSNLKVVLDKNLDLKLYDKKLQGFIYPYNDVLNNTLVNQGLSQLQNRLNKLSINDRDTFLKDIKGTIDSYEKLDLIENLFNSSILGNINISEFETIKFNFLKTNVNIYSGLNYLSTVLIDDMLDGRMGDMYMLRDNASINPYLIDSFETKFSSMVRQINQYYLSIPEKIELQDMLIKSIRPFIENGLSKTDFSYLQSEKETLILMLEYCVSNVRGLALNDFDNKKIIEESKNGIDFPKTEFKGKLYAFEIFKNGYTQAEIVSKFKELVENGDKETLKQVFECVDILNKSNNFNATSKDYSTIHKNAQKLLGGYEKSFGSKGPKHMKEFESFCKLSDTIEEKGKDKEIRQIGD